MNNYILFYFLLIIHLLIWLFVLFSGFVSVDYAKINILYVIPIIYLSYIVFDDCLLNKFEFNMVNTIGEIPTLDIYNFNKSLFNYSFKNPLSAHGMLILGFIIGVYTIAYKKSQITHS